MDPKTHTAVSISALESLKKMAQEVQDQRDELLAALKPIASCQFMPGAWRPEYEQMAQNAIKAIARCQESTKVME